MSREYQYEYILRNRGKNRTVVGDESKDHVTVSRDKHGIASKRVGRVECLALVSSYVCAHTSSILSVGYNCTWFWSNRVEIVHPGPMAVQVERMVAIVQIVLGNKYKVNTSTDLDLYRMRTDDNEVNNLDRIFRDHELVSGLDAPADGRVCGGRGERFTDV